MTFANGEAPQFPEFHFLWNKEVVLNSVFREYPKK